MDRSLASPLHSTWGPFTTINLPPFLLCILHPLNGLQMQNALYELFMDRLQVQLVPHTWLQSSRLQSLWLLSTSIFCHFKLFGFLDSPSQSIHCLFSQAVSVSVVSVRHGWWPEAIQGAHIHRQVASAGEREFFFVWLFGCSIFFSLSYSPSLWYTHPWCRLPEEGGSEESWANNRIKKKGNTKYLSWCLV